MKIPKFFHNLDRMATRPQTVQRDEHAALIWTAGGRIRLVSVPVVKGVRGLYIDKNDALREYKITTKKIKNNYPKHLQEFQKRIKLLLQTSKEVEKSVQLNLSSPAKIRAFKKWMQALEVFYLPITAPFAVESILDPECRNLLEKEFGKLADKYFAIISSPTKLTDYQKMMIEIANMKISNKNKPADFKILADKYGWYSEYSYIEPLHTEKYFQHLVLKLSKAKAKKEKRDILRDINLNKNNFKKLKRKIKNKKLKLLAQIINDYTFLRTYRIDQFKKSQVKIRPLFDFIAKELKNKNDIFYSREDITSLTNNEIIDFLKTGKIISLKEIEKRKKQNYIYYYENIPHLICNSNFVKRTLKLIEESELKNKEIVGTIAFKGIIRGKVKLVLSRKDLIKVKMGDILIAKTTMPDYTPAMKIAKAVVTEEGGITVHAAIFAREFKIPCIVGTEIATKVLKDGDLVEVDANKGLVKILK